MGTTATIVKLLLEGQPKIARPRAHFTRIRLKRMFSECHPRSHRKRGSDCFLSYNSPLPWEPTISAQIEEYLRKRYASMRTSDTKEEKPFYEQGNVVKEKLLEGLIEIVMVNLNIRVGSDVC